MPEVRPASRFPKAYADIVQRARVPLGFVMAGAFLVSARPDAVSLWLGLPVAAAGLAIRAWAAGHLAKNRTLAMSGPYARVRNPLYVGTMTAAFGLAVAARQPWLAAAFVLVFLAVYLPAIELEEQKLRELFPDFDAYAARVPMIVPRLAAGPAGDSFQWALYRKNEEYKAGLGLLVAVAYLAWRALTPDSGS